ncbi:MBL fold metallo-hydrolase [Clostridium sp.]|uniref:MBL fold metallo-hydrolase n=1 Tax=Clostridium sp. TaxID=1506 RepID=UPI002632431A|nr:MBL fold metallo-hydrolase [Clostridium sp.]
MIVKTITNGSLQENCYLIIDEETNKGTLVDPGSEGDRISSIIEDLKVNIGAILLTHCHYDHNGAVMELKERFDAKVYLNEVEVEYMANDTTGVYKKLPKVGDYVKEGEEILVGNLKFKPIFTPGHSKGGTCYLVEDKIFTGDTLFKGAVGRTDLFGSSFDELSHSVNNKLMLLQDNIEVYPGHGPSSTIGFERTYNPYVE